MSIGREVDTFFVLGGTLRRDAPSYITRVADEELLRLTLAGEYCNVLAARQMGKSSLMVRTSERLRLQGVKTAIIDLTAIGSDVTVDEWYFGLVSRLARQLRLDFDEQAWWRSRSTSSPVQRFSDFLRQVMLAQIAEPVVIFVDEIDSTLRLKFTDDFFASIRAMYNERANDATYQRLTFVLLGVARPADLIKDRTRTPYNIGANIDLTDFTLDEVDDVFLPVLEKAHPGQGHEILSSTLHWTGGQPYLTQKLCAEVATRPNGTITDQDIDQLVERLFLADEARKESNLQAIRDRVLSSPYMTSILRIYQQVLAGKRVSDEERSIDKNELKLVGLVRATPQGVLTVRNRIYAQVFDQAWTKSHLPVNRARQMAVVASLVAVLALIGAGVVVINQPMQAVQASVQTLTQQFRSSSNSDVRISSLASLFELHDPNAAEQARSLFNGLSASEQQALFTLTDPQSLGSQLVTVVEGLYQQIGNTPEGNQLLEAMAAALRQSGTSGVTDLVLEIESWLQGRRYAENNQFQNAIGSYTAALQYSPGSQNVGVLLDRARAHTELNQLDESIADLTTVIQLDPTDADTVYTELVNQPILATHYLLALINTLRTQNGLTPYQMSDQLNAAAAWHSRDMANTGKIDRTGSDGATPQQRITATGYSASTTDELIYGGDNNIDSAFSFWSNSLTHRSVLLSTEFHDVGISIITTTSQTFYTIDLAAPTVPSTSTPPATHTPTPTDTPTPTNTTSPTQRPATPGTAVRPTQASEIPLSLGFEIIRYDPLQAGNLNWTATLRLFASGGDGNYTYVVPNPDGGFDYQTGSEAFFIIRWRRCRTWIGELRVNDTSGHVLANSYSIDPPPGCTVP